MILDRRTFVLASAVLTAAGPAFAAVPDPFAVLEAEHGGRLGVAALYYSQCEEFSRNRDSSLRGDDRRYSLSLGLREPDDPQAA